MNVLNSVKVATTASLDVVTTTARTADLTVRAVYHAADVAHTHAEAWSKRAKDDIKAKDILAKLERQSDLVDRQVELLTKLRDKASDDESYVDLYNQARGILLEEGIDVGPELTLAAE